MEFELVYLESPYAGDVELNIEYAKAAALDCLQRGEAPFVSHLLYTQPGILNDNILTERDLGINAGFAWAKVASKSVFYIDLGISEGMRLGIENACLAGRKTEFRSLPNWQRGKP